MPSRSYSNCPYSNPGVIRTVILFQIWSYSNPGFFHRWYFSNSSLIPTLVLLQLWSYSNSGLIQTLVLFQLSSHSNSDRVEPSTSLDFIVFIRLSSLGVFHCGFSVCVSFCCFIRGPLLLLCLPFFCRGEISKGRQPQWRHMRDGEIF